jgi:hypothetical protein
MGAPGLAARRAIVEAFLPQELARLVTSGIQLGRAPASSPPSGLLAPTRLARFAPEERGCASAPGPVPLPRGALVEVVGRRSSGRFALALAALAAATSAGESAALVDLGDHLDPQGAAAEGVELSRLLWVRPRTLKDALSSAELLLGAGFALVVLELGLEGVRHRTDVSQRSQPTSSRTRRVRIEAAWIRLARRARAHEAALLVLTPYRASGTAAGVVLTARAARALWISAGAPFARGTRSLLAGLETRLVLEKARGERPGTRRTVTLHAPGGTDTCRSPRNPPPDTQALHAAAKLAPGGTDTCRSPWNPPPDTQALRAAEVEPHRAAGTSLLDERRVGHA